VRAADEADVRALLAPDPWLRPESPILAIGAVDRWRLWLGGDVGTP
jgi:hypothetical protein